jgi:cytochrome P450
MIAAESAKGPRGRWLLGNTLQFWRDPLSFLESCAREFGDVVPIQLGTTTFYLVSDPADIELAFTNSKRFVKSALLRGPLMRRISGNGIFVSEGAFWTRQRRLMQPAFHRDEIASYANIMVAATTTMSAGWSNGMTIDIHSEMMRLTLAIVCKALFNADIGNSRCTEVGAAMEILTSQFAASPNLLRNIAGLFLPIGRRSFEAAAKRLDAVVDALIEEHGSSRQEARDLLSTLMKARDEEGHAMTNRQIRDEVITLLLAGHETTALALTWTCVLLAQHPKIEASLVAELNRVLQDRMPRFEDWSCIAYLGKVIREAMRLYPPVWMTSRELADECKVGGRTLAKGTQLFMSQWVLHRDPRFYSNPIEFSPLRWTEDFIKTLPKYAYFPFGGGPRVCLGQSFAMLEITLVLATILQKWSLRLGPGQEILPHPSLTLRPKGPVQMLLEKRET